MIGFHAVGIAELFAVVRQLARSRSSLAPRPRRSCRGTVREPGFQMVIVLAATVLPFAAASPDPTRRGDPVSIALTILGVIWIAVPSRRGAAARAAPPRGARRHARHRDLRRRRIPTYAGGGLFGRPPACAHAITEQDGTPRLARLRPAARSRVLVRRPVPDSLAGSTRCLGMCVARSLASATCSESMISATCASRTRAPIFEHPRRLLDHLERQRCSHRRRLPCSRAGVLSGRERACSPILTPLTPSKSGQLSCRCPRSSCSSRQSRLASPPCNLALLPTSQHGASACALDHVIVIVAVSNGVGPG